MLASLKHRGPVTFYDEISETAWPTLHARGHTYDLVYIDGGHDAATARLDLEQAWPLTTGALVVHDVRMPGVFDAFTRWLDGVQETPAVHAVSWCNATTGTAVVWRRKS
jgi:hypothetical protein